MWRAPTSVSRTLALLSLLCPACSNPLSGEERRVAREEGPNKLARAIVDGIDAYHASRG